MNNRKIGIFEISKRFLDTEWRQVAEIFSQLKIVPIDVEYRYNRDSFMYTALCEQFEKVPLGETIPKYTIIVKRQEDGTIKASIEKLEENTKHGLTFGKNFV